MGAVYLTELAQRLRNVGLGVIEYPGWQTRARGSGGYNDYPLCVMWHHTASPASWDGQKDADYIAIQNPDAPVSNLYIQRDGTVWVIAAGATNTNGTGNSIAFSRGVVPQDSMNSHALGVEMGNDGIGERWPQVQVDAMFAVNNEVNDWFNNQPEDMSTHQFYAPTRKIDPATDNVEGSWIPKTVTSSRSWDRADVQAECIRRAAPLPMPEDDDDMLRKVLVPMLGPNDPQWWPWLATFDSGIVRPLVSHEPEPVDGKDEIDVGQYKTLCAWARINLITQP